MTYRAKVTKHTYAFVRVESSTLPVVPVAYITPLNTLGAVTGQTVDIEPTGKHILDFRVVRIVPMVKRKIAGRGRTSPAGDGQVTTPLYVSHRGKTGDIPRRPRRRATPY